jgi:ATP-dependent DNA helicase RecQ
MEESIYPRLNCLEPWLCVDLEINPGTRKLIQAGMFFKLKSQSVVSKTFDGESEKDFLKTVRQLLTSETALIGHNLRRHDLLYLSEKDRYFKNHSCCIDTLELFPLVFPSIRSYRLEKAYQDSKSDPLIGKKRLNHPALDCKETCDLLEEIIGRFEKIKDSERFDAYLALLGHDGAFGNGYRKALGGSVQNTEPISAFQKALDGNICSTGISRLRELPLTEDRAHCLANLLSLIPSDPDSKTFPPRPWVRHTYPEIMELLQILRGTDCGTGTCAYCRDKFDLLTQMGKIFRFPGDPQWRNEGQKEITEAVMRGKNIIGVLPTSGGKSLTFQLPALINANATGSLTVVISPLRSLMDDQVEKLNAEHCRDDVCQISGKLNSIERTRNLRSVRAQSASSDDSEKPVPAHIVYMAPEQLRSISVIRALAARGIGLLVVDEAHCMAKWGKDFRVDYRFIPKLIEKLCKDNQLPLPPVLCLTATARQEVLKEISLCFRNWMGIELEIIDRGHSRENLEFECKVFDEDSDKEKYEALKAALTPIYLQEHAALIFCGTKRRTEELASKLEPDGFPAIGFYHGGCSREHREDVQNKFISCDLKVVLATNAFGMGVDKKDIRLIVHYDIPGSLENYIQEAGRAGRDSQTSRCILFFDPSAIDMQLDLRRRNQLRRPELRRIILAIRNEYNRKKKAGEEFPEIIISARDLVKSRIKLADLGISDDDHDETDISAGSIDEKDVNLHERVTTAIGILEEGNHLRREENVFKFIPVPFRQDSWTRIEEIINNALIPDVLKKLLLNISGYLFNRSRTDDDFKSVDLEMMADQFNVDRNQVKENIDKLCGLGVCNWGSEYIIEWVKQHHDASIPKLDNSFELLDFQIHKMKESPISYSSGPEEVQINLDKIRTESKKITSFGYVNNLSVTQDLRLLSEFGLFEIVRRQRNRIFIKWMGQISSVEDKISLLKETCKSILSFLDSSESQKGRIRSKFNHDQFGKWLSSQSLLVEKDFSEVECEQALLYMDKREIIDVVDGFSILWPRMKLVPIEERIKENYDPAYREYEDYIKDSIAQVKAIDKFALLLSINKQKALDYVDDYFKMGWDDFKKKYFKEDERRKLNIPVRDDQFKKYFGTLTKQQNKAVQSPPGQNNLVIAGPGSGKTHVLVLRTFYLVKVRQIPAKSIAILAYNRNAAIELRRRLKKLLPRDWQEINVHTFHGLALRLIGGERLHELQSEYNERSEKGVTNQRKTDAFDKILDELKETLEEYREDDEHEQLKWLDRLNGIEYLLVDELQDIGEREYDILKLLSRLESKNRDGRVYVMAVGDDDQNLYAFRGSSVEWIQKFQENFKIEERIDLPDNFRSINSIIEVSNRVISSNPVRIKDKNWVQSVPESKKNWVNLQIKQDFDSGSVVRLKVNNSAEARYAIAGEIEAIRKAFPEIKHGEICIAHHTNAESHLTKLLLDGVLPVNVLGEHKFAPRYEMGVIEVIQELEKLDPDNSNISCKQFNALLTEQFTKRKIDPSWRNSWDLFLDEKLIDISPDSLIPVKQMLWRIDEYLIGRSGQSVQTDKIASMTLHATKGLEFHTVFLFPPSFGGDKIDELRRLYFVGLSRAKVKAYLIDFPGCNSQLWDEMSKNGGDSIITRGPQSVLKSPTEDKIKLADEFRFYDTVKRLRSTGMNIFFVANQPTVTSLSKNQILDRKIDMEDMEKPKIDFWAQNHRIGRMTYQAARDLLLQINNDESNIIKVELAQVIETDTPEDARHSYNNGLDRHYYIIPRIFYRACRVR